MNKKGNTSLLYNKRLVAYSFLLPNFIGFAVFTLIPVVFALALSLMNWDGANEITFAGLKNFRELISDETFRISLLNTFYYSAGTVPLTIICSLGLALLLNQPIKGRNAIRAVYFFPYVASLVAVAVVWNMILNPTMGPVNEILQKVFHIAKPPRWSASVDWAMPTVIIVSIWKNMGYYMIIYLAGLQGIPRELYEAAKVDGAGNLQCFFRITLPMLTPSTFFVSIMLTISCFKIFDLIFVMTGGGPGRATNVLVVHAYNVAFKNFNFGYSSAISLVLFIIVLCITIIQFRMEKKWVSYF
ncbi:MAG: sugar ABC transporter permease [Spirochaetes bacterium]|nr:sugar ABC transporter permease [Spirochaetota bacterium]